MKVTIERAETQEILPSENPSRTMDLRGRSRKPPRRRTKNPGGRGFRQKRQLVVDPSARICSRPETPLLKWKFDGRIANNDESLEEEHSREGRIRTAVSARKLAAGLWRMKLPDGQDQRFSSQSGERDFAENALNNGGDASPVRGSTSSRHSVSSQAHRLPFKYPKSDMERETWASKPRSAAAIISALEAELDQAKVQISELESERRSSNKKLKQFLERVSEEKAAWRSREHDKVRAIISELKVELNQEKKNRQRLEMVNAKLVNELANVKLSAKRYVQEYEKERKSRELIEEVCDELAKEIGEDKAEVEALKQEAMQVREEVEDERKMLQMAEIWREERVQMKLVDAKVMLEEKYSQMNQLIADLDCFLRSTSQAADSGEIKKAQFLKQVAASVNMHDVRNMKYEPPNPDEIFSIFENVIGDSHQGVEEEEPSVGYSPVSHASNNIHTVNSEIKKVSKDNARNQRNGGYINQIGVVDDDTSEWETVSQAEDDRGSSYGSDPSVRKDFRAGIERKNNGGADTPIIEISEGSSASKLWKSCPISRDNYKTISVDGHAESRLSNGPEDNGSKKGDFSPYNFAEQISSPESAKRAGTQTKGCIEWPTSGVKGSLKARLMEARTDNRKIQLRQVLQQKM